MTPNKQTATMAHGRRAPWLTLRCQETLEAWLFVSPTLIGFLIFFLGPLVAVGFYSLTEWNLLSQRSTFVGLENFQDALTQNPDFWHVVRNSAVFALGLVPLNMALALTLALALPGRLCGNFCFRARPALSTRCSLLSALTAPTGCANRTGRCLRSLSPVSSRWSGSI